MEQRDVEIENARRRWLDIEVVRRVKRQLTTGDYTGLYLDTNRVFVYKELMDFFAGPENPDDLTDITDTPTALFAWYGNEAKSICWTSLFALSIEEQPTLTKGKFQEEHFEVDRPGLSVDTENNTTPRHKDTSSSGTNTEE